MNEIELRFQVPAAARRAVETGVATATAQRTRLQAIYFDTPDRRLAKAGIALRLRKEGRQWVQTLKAGDPHAMQRFEHNVVRPRLKAGVHAESLQPDLALHEGTDGGALLARALRAERDEPSAALSALFRTDILRCHRPVRTPEGSVELAFDVGFIIAGARRMPVCELEIELLRGSPSAVTSVASRWVARHGVWLEVRSKAERGERLAQDPANPPAPLHKASALQLTRSDGLDAAFRAVVANGLAHALPNASEIASGVYTEQHLHQLRVALRRLRTALRFFEGWTESIQPAWSATLAATFAQLGAIRDRDALAAAVVPDLRDAGAPWFELPPLEAAADPVAVVRAAALTQTWLELLALGPQEPVPTPRSDARAFHACAAERLGVWLHQVRSDARRFEGLDDPARHRLRRRVKRLRYAAEILAPLHAPKSVAQFMKGLAPVQDSLGHLNDVNVALTLYRSVVERTPAAWFAVGRLSARREALMNESAVALKAFRRVKPFW
jgi:triphosphatase